MQGMIVNNVDGDARDTARGRLNTGLHILRILKV